MSLILQKYEYIQSVESKYLSNYERVDLNFNLVKVLHLWAQEKVIYLYKYFINVYILLEEYKNLMCSFS